MQDADKVEGLPVDQERIRKEQRAIRRILVKYSSNDSELDEWTQEVVVHCWTRRIPVQYWRKKAHWLGIELMRNKTGFRRKTGIKFLLTNCSQLEQQEAKADLSARDFKELLESLQLFPRERELVEALFAHDMTQKQVGRRWGVAESNVSTAITQLKQHIKGLLHHERGQRPTSRQRGHTVRPSKKDLLACTADSGTAP
jgi:RNA polymerase sigma factor (sigma-70 family)